MENRVKAIVMWSADGEKTAREIGEKYKKAMIEVVFYGMGKEEDSMTIGQDTDATHVLYFIDSQKILLVSLTDEMGGFSVEIGVEDLTL